MANTPEKQSPQARTVQQVILDNGGVLGEPLTDIAASIFAKNESFRDELAKLEGDVLLQRIAELLKKFA